MIYLRIIGFILALTAVVGIDRYLDNQYHFSLVREAGQLLKLTTNNLLTIPDLKSPSGSKPVSAPKEESGGPCNSLGKCDKANEICEPVDLSGKTELRCVSVPPPEKISEESTKSTPSTKPRTGSSIPSSTPIANTSSYGKGKIRISVSASTFSSGSASVIYLYPNLNQGETLNIDGWQIKTGRTGFFMPRAVPFYEWSGINNPEPLVLKSGDSVNIYSTDSKISVNFRLNKCLGYFQTVTPFNPSLPLSCPVPYTRAEIANLNPSCQNYIISLGSCAIPNTTQPFDPTCREYLNKIGYYKCVNDHRGDSDFFSREWRIFLGAAGSNRDLVDPQHDRVQLLNKAGTLIDEYIY